jgi:probable phosphomutase (TIGR03848 family)
MATVLLLRHGRTSANANGILAGRTPGIELDAVGIEQATRAAERIGALPLVGIVTSPLERCRQTAALVASRQDSGPTVAASLEQVDDEITECDYGDWQGRALSELSKEPLWAVVQRQPSAAVFPGGESMTAMQFRSVAAIRRHDAAFEQQFGPVAVWAAVSHADIIKSVLADALGMPLDRFQRINIGPASVSIIRYGSEQPQVLATNTDSGDLSWLRAADPLVG